jgi:PleD family two-component response regulator
MVAGHEVSIVTLATTQLIQKERAYGRCIWSASNDPDRHWHPTDKGRSVRLSGAGRMRSLVAEDDAATRLIFEAALQNFGHTCQTVVDGSQAWDRFRSFHPDPVISDWNMPKITGLELCRRFGDSRRDPMRTSSW